MPGQAWAGSGRWRLAAAAAACAAAYVASPAAGARFPLQLDERVLGSGEFPGYEYSEYMVITSPVEWSASFRFVSPRDLRRIGFVAVAIEKQEAARPERRLGTSLVSVVVQFRSSLAAAQYLLVYATLSLSNYKRFSVPGLAGAVGIDAARQGGGFFEVVFNDGPFFYDLETHTIDPTVKFPSRRLIGAAAVRWYRRVQGRPPA